MTPAPDARRARVATAFLAAAGLAGSALAARLLPLPADDPFRGTLAVLPLVLGGFAAIHRFGRAGGGRALPRRATAAEAVALALLVLLVLARAHLGLPVADEVPAAGLLLLLFHRLALQLLALRPLLGREVPARPSAAFFALPFVAYLALLPWSTFHRPPDGDEPFYLLVTHSLAYDFDAELTDDYAAGEWRHFMDRPIEPQPGDPRGPHGEIYSRHNELLPLLLAPAYRLGGKAGALAAMAAATAALAWMTLRLARRYFPGRPGEALAAYALVAFAPPLLLYSYQVWVEVPAALLAAVALDQVHEPRGGFKKWLAVGLAIGLLPLLKIRFLLLAVPLLALAWWQAGRPRRPALALALLLVLVAGGMLLYNQHLYQNPLKIHTWREVEPSSYGPFDYLRGLAGIFWDAAFGLFGAAPLWLLSLPAALLLAFSRHPLPRDLAVFSLPYLAVVAPRPEWYGGWSPPFRYALVVLPLLGLALVPLLARRRGGGARATLAALGAATLALALLFVLVPGWTYNFADGRTYLLDHLGARLGLDVARLFPSAVRPRAATWIWPPLSLAAVSLLYAFPRRRLRHAGLWGVAGLLALAGTVPGAAARLPTRVVELEDAQVEKAGGHPEPERWVIDRTRFRGAWVLREGESLRAPVAPGGKRLRLTLHVFFVRHHPGPLKVGLLAGELPLATGTFDRPQVWEARSFGPFDWPAGVPLTIALPPAGRPGVPNGMLFDRVELEWH